MSGQTVVSVGEALIDIIEPLDSAEVEEHVGRSPRMSRSPWAGSATTPIC